MTSERWHRMEAIFHGATERPAAERAAWLADACQGDVELRREVESLLAAGADAALIAEAGDAVRILRETNLTPGRRFGHFEIVAAIGAGGMGEVYHARDLKLGRDVAIKILPSAFATDAERLVRFEREARLLAALNHPNIATLHGLEDTDGVRALVMELVPGETLADRLARADRGLPLAEILALEKQIVDALDAAHEKGIIHRDLKPANIKVTADGVVKVLDFGLAKLHPAPGNADTSQHVTISAEQTRDGRILGTPAYMSPEQARGQAVDKRTDIWAFGCVLFEMLTGRAAFGRDTWTDTLAAVLEREPDWSALPSNAPPQLRDLTRRCLTKDPKQRLRDIGDATPYFDAAVEPARTSPAARSAVVAAGGWIAALLVGGVATLVWMTRGQQPAPTADVAIRSTVTLPRGQRLTAAETDLPIAISRDGMRIAFVAENVGSDQLFVRELRSAEVLALPGTSGARLPFFSPDGQRIGFFANNALQTISVTGGAPSRICDVEAQPFGGAWGKDDAIVFATSDAELMTVNAAGGTPHPLTGSGPATFPDVLADGETVLFTTGEKRVMTAIATIPIRGGPRRIVARLATSPLAAEDSVILGAGGDLAQATFAGRYLLFGQSPGRIIALPFDDQQMRVTGAPVVIEDSAMRARAGGGVYFAASRTGTLVFATGGARHQLVWADRQGRTMPITTERHRFRLPRLSPDGRWIAVAMSDDTRRSDIWIYDAVRGTRRRLTAEGHNLEPLWTHDSKSVVFSSSNPAGVLRKPMGGGEASVLLPGVAAGDRYPTSLTADDGVLVFFENRASGSVTFDSSGRSLRMLNLPGRRVVFAKLSPDNHWMAYESDESGRPEVYVVRYPDLTDRTAISSSGGTRPVWSRDGRELFYRQGDGVISVRIALGPQLRADPPVLLFSGPFSGESQDPSFDVAADGRFLMVLADEDSNLQQLQMTQHWETAVRQRSR
ncbi:MAG TPA: protein kinase [Vicinamibacterales bacterium]|nr:protein kinase [Vicinamibacterales bacterium]